MDKDTLTIGGQNFEVIRKQMKQTNLIFYPDNPRIYSIVYNGDETPSQYEIEKRLSDIDHVKQLSQSIKANGGLIDPILIRDGDNVVIEGNCRLAAYRILAKKDSIKWGRIKCVILPKNINDDSIFKLLGQYHIIGRKDWAPFEQAGYLWRRKQKYDVNEANMAKEMGIAVSRIKRLIKIYKFMSDKNDLNSQHWSYYEEYFKSSALKKVRKTLPQLDDTIVGKIKSGEFSKSNIDIRHLAKIAKLKGKDGKKLIKQFINGEENLENLMTLAEYRGADNKLLKSLRKFRVLIFNNYIKKNIKNMPIPQLNSAEYELKKIKKRSLKLLTQIKNRKQKKKGHKYNKEFQHSSKDEKGLEIKARDIPQYSNFAHSIELLDSLMSNKDGLSFIEIGSVFLDDNKSTSALKKYGENHAKLAELLDFVRINNGRPRKVFITDIGEVYLRSNNLKRKKILLKQIQQMPLIKDIKKKDIKKFDLYNYLKKHLADSTAKRRYSNVKQIIKLLSDNNIQYFVHLYKKID